jgi:hypothetical protein
MSDRITLGVKGSIVTSRNVAVTRIRRAVLYRLTSEYRERFLFMVPPFDHKMQRDDLSAPEQGGRHHHQPFGPPFDSAQGMAQGKPLNKIGRYTFIITVTVGVGVSVGVAVGVGVCVGVRVLVGVGVGASTAWTLAENSEVLPSSSVAVAVTQSSA